MTAPRNGIVHSIGLIKPSLSACVALLRQRHESVLAAVGGGPQARQLENSLVSLRLAEACLEKAKVNRQQPKHPLQIAVIGPTQSGKSSLVNRLLGAERAQVSPLAGYTVHPQGFPLNTAAADWDWLERYFHDYRRCRPEELPVGQYAHFALGETLNSPRHPLPPSIVWDTPDFDSVDAGGYRNAVLRTAALADVLLLVVSKDKYADQSVWDTLCLLEPLGQPTVVCLNKLDAGSGDTLVLSLREKWRAARWDRPVGISVMPWVEDLNGALPAEEGGKLLQLLAEACGAVDRASQPKRAQELARTHWPDWLAPVRQELAAQAEWAALVDEAFAEALTLYRRDFLDHPHHYETFQRALAELLTLLEIPGLAGGMVAARKVLTWPARQLARLGQSVRGKENLGQETAVLNRTLEHLFIHLGQALLDKSGGEPAQTGFWRALGVALREERKTGEPRRAAALARHVQAFQPEIERTAHQLHDKLSEQPRVLNALRATRATTDAVGLALALNTGGIGVQDFIIAPAILSVTSMLAESALGHFLHRAEAELKQRQYRETAKLFEEILRPPLLALPERLAEASRFNVPAGMVDAVEEMLGLP
ncbi:MAG: GTPase [Candidatus Methylumidiphilus sp.]